MGCFTTYNDKSSFERVMSPLRTQTNGGDYKLHMTTKNGRHSGSTCFYLVTQ